MTQEYSRIRVDADQADLWLEILLEALDRRIARKIELREHNPEDQALEAVRWELAEIHRMREEVRRAKADLASG